MRGYRPALRMARRDALRAKGRTTLVMCMIGLPVAVIVAVAVLVATMDWSPRESLPYELGTADARISGAGHAPIRQDPVDDEMTFPRGGASAGRPWTTQEITRRITAEYGPRARVLPLNRGKGVELKTPRGYRRSEGVEVDVRDPLARGLYRITRGRAPAGPGEIALSPSLAGREFPIGSAAPIDRQGTVKRVVGTVEDPRAPGDHLALALPGVLPDPLGATAVPGWLVGTGRPVTWADVTELNKEGIGVLSRAVVGHPPPAASPPGAGSDGGAAGAIVAMVVVMIVLEVVLLAGPAFAVGIRRRRRMLALVAVAGGSGGHLRAIVLAGGLVLGGAAALAGGALGVAGAGVATLVVQSMSDDVLGPFDVPWLQVALAMALGAGSGVVAAYVPARQAARMDVVAALAGRRERGMPRGGWPIAGAAAIAAGVFLSLVGVRVLREFGAALGAAAIIAGCVMAGPWLVGAAGRAAGRLPVPLRLAVRDGARNRGRSAPAVAAIMAAVAGVTALAIANASDLRQARMDYVPRLPMGSALIRPPLDRIDALRPAFARELPGVPLLDMRVLPGENSSCLEADTSKCPSVRFAGRDLGGTRSGYMDAVVGGAPEARMVLGRDDPAVTAALAQGKIVVFASRPLPGGTTTATVSVWENDRPRVLKEVPGLPAVGVEADPHVPALVPPSAAAKIGVPARVEGLGVDRASHRLTADEQARLTEVVAGASEVPADGAVYVERGFTRSGDVVMLLLAAAGGVLALGGALIATGLSSADARPDLATLAAIGARPRTRRLLMTGQAGFVATLGCWLGIAAGAVPGIAAAGPLTNEPAEPGGAAPSHGTIVDIPGQVLLIIGVAVPLVAMLAAGILTRSRLPMSHRIAS
ncbi:ABC transporter permease [Actinomadura graeca]|uniref:ABC transporter permease n=1 Tax=Actinomadura graeca TaxID=2750812 RepID=A0ABX8R1N8_9ACTN|nr:FtsX-like permease family protein [Actinomadura graeca]QXJ24808.1 ABC transporter permease [Actinomadura graeca]